MIGESTEYRKNSECNYLLLLLGCLIYIAVLLLWYHGYVDEKFVIFGGISALITILNSYDSAENRKLEPNQNTKRAVPKDESIQKSAA